MAYHQTVSPIPLGFRLPTVRCFQCGKLVDDVIVDISDHMMEITIGVRCHGAADQMTISAMSLEEIGHDALLDQEGVAFQPKAEPALSAPVRRLSHG